MPRLSHWLCLVGALIASSALPRIVLGQQKIVKWEIQATVIEVIDPNGLFPDVRLGDPVRGWMSYDRGNDAVEEFSLGEENVAVYQTLPGFHGVSMVIENPRGGAEVRFTEDRRFDAIAPGTVVNIGNDYEDPNDGPVDWVWVDKGVLPPPGSLSGFADIAVFLYGPGTILPDLSQPAELNLDDWPHAIIEFRDNFLHQDPTEIIAEIYSLTPVAVAPGDYDSNGVVDYDDYGMWVRGYVTDWPGVRNADGNGNGVVDAADYTTWRDNLGAAGSAHQSTTAPEPQTAWLLSTWTAIGAVMRRRRAVRVPLPR